MSKRHRELFSEIANFEALRRAAYRAIRGKRRKPGASVFFANLERELLALERQLLHGAYRPGKYFAFEVNDPKKRIVSAAPFRDRVVHHALCAVVCPIFEGRLHRPDLRQSRMGSDPAGLTPWHTLAIPLPT